MKNNIDTNQAILFSNTMKAMNNPDYHQQPYRGDGLGFWDTIGEMYMQETIIGDSIRYGLIPTLEGNDRSLVDMTLQGFGAKDKYAENYEYDPNYKFNPYKYYTDRLDSYGDQDLNIRQGFFDDIKTEKQFIDRANRLRKLEGYRNELANGNFLGMLVGGVATFGDISTLIPIAGLYKKGKTLATIGRYALGGAIYVGAQESALHLRQELRTVQESAYNLGGVILIGGGIGAFSSASFKGSALHHSNPNNPFRADNPVYLAIGDMGRGLANSVVFKPIIKAGKRTYQAVDDTWQASGIPTSAGAAAVKQYSGTIGTGFKTGAKGVVSTIGKVGMKGLDKIAKTRIVGSPIYRLLTSTSERAARIGEQLFDTGGILTKANEAGIYIRNVESEANNIRKIFDEGVFPDAIQRFVDLRIKLAEMAGKTQREIGLVAEDIQQNVMEFGRNVLKGPSKINKTTANKTGNLDEFEFTDLTNKALYDDISPDEIKNLKERFGDDGADLILKTVKDQADLIHDANKLMEDLMIETGMIKASEAMGRQYGKAQLWVSEALAMSPREAKDFFYKLLLDDIPDDWLADTYGMTKKQFDDLGVKDVTTTDGTTYKTNEGMGIKQEIFEDWSGELKNNAVARAELDLDLAIAHEKSSRQKAVLAARELRKSDTEIKDATVAEAQKVVEARIRDQEIRVAELRKKKLQIQELKAKLKKKLEEDSIRDKSYHDVGGRTKQLQNERITEVTEAEELLKLAEKNAEAKLANLNKTEIKDLDDLNFARDNLTKADNKLARAGDDALEESVEKLKNKKVSNTNTGRLEGTINQLIKETKYLQKHITRHSKRLAPVIEEVKLANQAKLDARAKKKILNAAKKEFGTEARKAKRSVKKAKRILKKTSSKPSIQEYIDDLYIALSSPTRGNMRVGGLDGEIAQSGRTKMRQFKLTNAQRREAEGLGFLRDDLYGIMMKSFEDLSARIALRKVFNANGEALGSEQKILDKLINDITDDYTRLINAAEKAGKSKSFITKLEKELNNTKLDVELGFRRHLGLLGNANTNGLYGLAWAGQTARSINYVRYGSGFLLPSLADLANVVFTSGWGSFSYMNLFSKKSSQLRKALGGLNNQEVIRLAIASERILSNSRTMKMAGAETTREMTGVGAPGTVKHYLTSNTDKVLDGLSRATNTLSFMGWWNTRMKSLVMLEMQHNFVNFLQKYPKLIEKASAQPNSKFARDVAKAASLGLGKEQIARILKLIKKHPPTKSEPGAPWELEMGRWLDEGADGIRAYHDMRTAFENVATRSIMTPGKGDLPYFMSNGIWKSILQFWTYGFISMSKYMIPAFQRMARYGDMEAFGSLTLAGALGTGIVMLSDLRYQGKIKDRDLTQWGYDVMDRAGFLMMLSVPLAEAGKFVGVFEQPSRYSAEKNRWSLLLGPTAGLVEDALDLSGAVRDADTDRIQQIGNKLLPFKIYKQIYDVTIGDK